MAYQVTLSLRYPKFHEFLIAFGIVSIILWSFVLAGCTSSSGLRNVYLFALSYEKDSSVTESDPLLTNKNITQVLGSQISDSAEIIREVRVGYLAMCIAFRSGVWSCGTNVQQLAALVSSGDEDPLNLLRLAQRARTRILFYPLIIISLVLTFIVICIIAVGPHVLGREEYMSGDEEDSATSRNITRYPALVKSILPITIVIALFGFISAFWQHIGGAGASTLTGLLTYDLVIARVGTTGIALGWTAAGFSTILATGTILSHLSIRFLSNIEGV
ncbi:hypothetical protein F5X98DRAFT_350462 [Xylaria grammica]|nr:hypothetical protein F5X98DRAFT_350462 [Xylaria grammica]